MPTFIQSTKDEGEKMIQKQSWKITDEFWEVVKDLLPERKRDPNKQYKRKPGAGRPPIERRRALEAIFFVMRTGIQWKALPKERFGAASAIHRYFQFWCEQGAFKNMWAAGLEKYDEVKCIDWKWLSVDGCMSKAPLAQESVGKNPTDRGKNGEQTSSPRRRQRRAAINSSNRSASA